MGRPRNGRNKRNLHFRYIYQLPMRNVIIIYCKLTYIFFKMNTRSSSAPPLSVFMFCFVFCFVFWHLTFRKEKWPTLKDLVTLFYWDFVYLHLADLLWYPKYTHQGKETSGKDLYLPSSLIKGTWKVWPFNLFQEYTGWWQCLSWTQTLRENQFPAAAHACAQWRPRQPFASESSRHDKATKHETFAFSNRVSLVWVKLNQTWLTPWPRGWAIQLEGNTLWSLLIPDREGVNSFLYAFE